MTEEVLTIIRKAERQIAEKTGGEVKLICYPTHIGSPVYGGEVEQMLRIITMSLGIKRNDLRNGSKKRELVTARYTVIKLLRDYFPTLTWTKIAGYINRDHTSAIHGYRQANNFLETEDAVFTPVYQTAKKAVEKWLK